MSVISQSVVPNDFFNLSPTLSDAIQRDTDPVEDRIDRTASRRFGVLLGLFSIGPVQGCLLADALTDARKILIIEHHLAKLSDADESGVEKQIYTEIAQYTKSARIVKLFSATIGAIGAIRLNFFEKFDALTVGCICVSFAGVAASVIHRYTEGSAMKERHKQMLLGPTFLTL